MKKKLLTRSNFTRSPKELFSCIESNYFFGRQRKNQSEIRPYFIITDGSEIVVYDDGIKRTCGINIIFKKRPSLFTGRFWNSGPNEFKKMILKFIKVAFSSMVDFNNEQKSTILENIKILETLTAIYSIDKKYVLPIYIVKLPSEKVLQMTFNNVPGHTSTMSIEDFIQMATIGNGHFDAISSAISYLIGYGEIVFPKSVERI